MNHRILVGAFFDMTSGIPSCSSARFIMDRAEWP